jgi:PAS domain S-box-containing protein
MAGRVSYANERAEAIWAMPSGSALGYGWLGRVHADDRDALLEQWEAACRRADRRRGSAVTQYRLLLDDGTIRWVRVRCVPRHDEHGRAVGVVGTARDVTEERAARQALRASEARFRNLVEAAHEGVWTLDPGGATTFANPRMCEMLGLDAATMDGRPVFEFLSPADAVEMRTRLQSRERGTAETRELILRRADGGDLHVLVSASSIVGIDGAFDGTLLLVTDVTERVRLEAQLRQSQKMEAIGQLAGGVAHDFNNLLTVNIAIECRLASSVPAVLADPGQLDRVLVNLAVNARDAMPQGGRLVLATSVVRRTDRDAACDALSPGLYVRLTVSDTGIGMDDATMARIFEPFYSTKEPGRGTGLGLSTIYGIVRQSGGAIRVASALGAGTTFTIDLPAAATRPARAQGPLAAADAVPPGNATILLVEDERAVRAAVRRFLLRAGYSVLEAAHGAEALDVALRHAERIDLVLTDVVMPEMSGRAFVERLAASHPEMRVLFMSGYTDDEILRRGLRADGTAFVEKPFTAERLLAAVRDALRS